MPSDVAPWLKAALTGAAKRLTESAEVRLHLALVHIRAQHYDRAIAELQEALQIAAKRPVPEPLRLALFLHLAAAQSLRARDEPAEALATLEEALKLDGAHAGTWLALALVLMAARSWEAAAVALSVPVLRGSSEALNNLGVVCMAQGQLAEAARHFHAALQADRAHAEAANNYAVTLLHLGEADAAAQVLERVCEQEEGAHVWANLACAWRATGAVERARDACHQALKACLWSEAVRFGVARQFLRDGYLKEAHQTLAALARVRPAPHYATATAMVLFARQQPALHGAADAPPDELQRALAAAADAARPSDARGAASQLSLQALLTGDYSRAVRLLAAHPALHAPHATTGAVWCNLAAALQLDEQPALAALAYERALPLVRPAHAAVVHNNLGVLRRQLRRLDDAEASLRQAAALAPRWAAPLVNLGLVHAAHGPARYAAAHEAWQEALRVEPSCAAALHNSARLSALIARSGASS